MQWLQPLFVGGGLVLGVALWLVDLYVFAGAPTLVLTPVVGAALAYGLRTRAIQEEVYMLNTIVDQLQTVHPGNTHTAFRTEIEMYVQERIREAINALPAPINRTEINQEIRDAVAAATANFVLTPDFRAGIELLSQRNIDLGDEVENLSRRFGQQINEELRPELERTLTNLMELNRRLEQVESNDVADARTVAQVRSDIEQIRAILEQLRAMQNTHTPPAPATTTS